jgi:hypothetical protein
MATREWSAAYEAAPAGTDTISGGDDQIRNLKADIRERMANGGHYMQDAVAPWSKDGRHVRGGAADPTWYKADAVTALMTPSSDTLVTVAENFAVTKDATITQNLSVLGDYNLPYGYGENVTPDDNLAAPADLVSCSYNTSNASRDRMIIATLDIGARVDHATTPINYGEFLLQRSVGGGAWTTVRQYATTYIPSAILGGGILPVHARVVLSLRDTTAVAVSTNVAYRVRLNSTYSGNVSVRSRTIYAYELPV